MRPLLFVSWLLLVHLAYAEAEHECGHILPERVGYTSTINSRARRDATARQLQPIRIVPVYYEEDFKQLASGLELKYKSAVEKAINYLSSFLKVQRLAQNVKLQRFCSTSSGVLGSLNPFDHCTRDAPCQSTYCAFEEFQIPENHLRACKTCDTPNSATCATNGQDGAGVPDADFVVYVAARPSRCTGNFLAYAAHCFHDKSTDRPIAGVINLCPRLASEQDIDYIALLISHELTHALVFSARLMPFYRDADGNPRTPRDNFGLPSTLGINDSIFWFQPSSDTILQETVRREALNGVYDIDTVKVVTPAVLREARNHFGCSTLNGMELENLGPQLTRHSHWKEKLVENEGMTGILSVNGVFSRLTFALYDDSGWYDVDYSVASPLRFGQCLGCDFAEKSCFSYGLDREPYCKDREIVPLRELQRSGQPGVANTSCTYDRLAIAACDLADVTKLNLSVPIQYQYFSDPNLGGSQVTSDYCPIHRALTAGHCQHQRDLNALFMESVGSNSKCVDLEIRENLVFKDTNLPAPPIHAGACYEVSCASEGEVAITVGQTEVLCQSAGQEVIVPATGYDIIIICPAFDDVCWESTTTCTTATTSNSISGLTSGEAFGIALAFGVIFLGALAVMLFVIYKRHKMEQCSSRESGRPTTEKGAHRGAGGLEVEA